MEATLPMKNIFPEPAIWGERKSKGEKQVDGQVGTNGNYHFSLIMVQCTSLDATCSFHSGSNGSNRIHTGVQ